MALLVGIVVSQFIRIVGRPSGDFPLHYFLAENLVAGEYLWPGGTHTPYPPFWALAHAPLTVLPLHAAQIVLYPFMLAAGVLLLYSLAKMSRPDWVPGELFCTIALALFLSGRYWVRDLVECLSNTGLVALTWFGILSWTRGKDILGGISIGLAIALKLTALLFVPYFLWKRQWRIAIAASVAGLVFFVSPALVMGADDYASHVGEWTGRVIDGARGNDPSMGINGEEAANNLSLRPSLARFLMKIPEGHRGRVDHPFYKDVLTLPPPTAAWIIRVVLVCGAIAVAWLLRGRADRDDQAILWECASVSALMLLYSPVTWSHHCVGLIPACFFLSRAWLRRFPFDTLSKILLGVYVFTAMLINRVVVGLENIKLLEAYQIETVGLVALVIVLLRHRSLLRSGRIAAGTVSSGP